MKSKLFALLLTTLAVSACQQEDLVSDKAIESSEQAIIDGIEVKDGYLSFASSDVFQEYLTSLEEGGSSEIASTRSGKGAIQGFTSIASLKNRCWAL